MSGFKFKIAKDKFICATFQEEFVMNAAFDRFIRLTEEKPDECKFMGQLEMIPMTKKYGSILYVRASGIKTSMNTKTFSEVMNVFVISWER
jgi:hypothetical protein